MGDRMKHPAIEASAARLGELGSEVSAALEHSRVAHDGGSRVRAKLVAREVPSFRGRARPTRRMHAVAIVGVLSVAATIAVAIAWPRRQSQSVAALSFVVGSDAADPSSDKPATPHENTARSGVVGAAIAAPPAAETPITFSDGSKLRLAPSARVRVADVGRDGARVLVETGAVHVSVVHKQATRWAVEAGPFEVRVTGTKFEVVWDPAASGLRVRLEEGSVFVRGCGLFGDEGRRLTTGEELAVSCPAPAATGTSTALGLLPQAPTARTSPAEGVAPRPSALPGTVPSAHEPAPSSPSVTPVGMPAASSRAPADVIAFARRGAHREALMAAEAGGFASTCEALSAPELLLLADSSRYAGRFDRANEALDATRRRFSGTDAAAAAAFELGRIAMDIRSDLSAAGDHFEAYLRERPNGSLAREALGRAIEARHRAGDGTRAEHLSVRYLAAYPDGPHAKLARKLSVPDTSEPRARPR
jgi:transmembrane sensor